MRVVTRRTGISPEVLRIWERRYGVVKPGRTQTGRRLYSDAEIERLHLLFRATQRGHSIGLVASLSTAALVDLLRQDAIGAPGIERTPAGDADVPPAAHLLGQCLRALESFQPESLGASLQRAALSLPATQFLESVVEPFVDHVEARGREGSLRSVHAHLASVVVRQALEQAIVPAPPQSPKLLVVTLPGQAQANGALSLAVLAAAQAWSVTWLGTGLSADEIAEASEQLQARAVALSLTSPTADAGVLAELRRLPDALPPQVRVLARSARGSAYVAALDEIGAVHTATISGFSKRILELASADGAGTAHARTKRLRKPR